MPHKTRALKSPQSLTLRSVPILIAAVLLTAACASTRPSPGETVEPGADTGDYFHQALHWSRNSAEHRAIFEQTYTLALRRVEELAGTREPGTWAVSLDADETLIDNSAYQLRIGQRGEVFGPESWNQWVQEGVAPALPGAVNFTREVKSLGGIIAVVTNRRTHQCKATADNLRAVDITYDIVLCRREDREKEPRWAALNAGTASDWPDAQIHESWSPGPVILVMWVGDNIGDFPHLSQAMRKQQTPVWSFGGRFFVLPNPMYGSWEANPKE